MQSFAAPGVAGDLALAPDNASFYSAGREGAVHAWKLAAPVPTRNFPQPGIGCRKLLAIPAVFRESAASRGEKVEAATARGTLIEEC